MILPIMYRNYYGQLRYWVCADFVDGWQGHDFECLLLELIVRWHPFGSELQQWSQQSAFFIACASSARPATGIKL